MEKLTQAQLYAKYGENVLHTQSTRRNPIWDAIDELEVGEAIVMKVDEWPIKNNAPRAVNDHYKKMGRKFRSRQKADQIIILRTE